MRDPVLDALLKCMADSGVGAVESPLILVEDITSWVRNYHSLSSPRVIIDDLRLRIEGRCMTIAEMIIVSQDFPDPGTWWRWRRHASQRRR